MPGLNRLLSSGPPLFIFEMANNHMGSLAHGLRIIREVHAATTLFQDRFRLAFKLQYRHLETFIHPAYRERNDIKYVKRFRDTQLEDADFRALKAEMDQLGFLSICTPFDEQSVDRIEHHGIGIIKIASCSLTDWPLLERIVATGKPIIASTAGASLEDIDKVVSFLQHREKDFALMHCVAQYPTPAEGMEMNQVDLLRERYPGVPVGFSTHESPEGTTPVQMAIAKGARIFEKHVGLPAREWPVNAYSATPWQARRWLESACEAFSICGVQGRRSSFAAEETESLQALWRGAFAARPISTGETLRSADLFLAIPTQPGQLTASNLSKYVTLEAKRSIAANEPILSSDVEVRDSREQIYAIIRRVNSMILEAGVVVPGQAELEISHHYGLGRFEEVGATIINLVNREYCKKLIVMLPGQRHPEHYHKLKEETFLVLHGDISFELDGRTGESGEGALLIVGRGSRHSFSTKRGMIMEEISSTHQKGDSYYTDPAIPPADQRKTAIAYWMGAR